jgi:hypothetical protein
MAPNVDHKSPVDFLMVAGDGRDDEVIFRWANELGADKTVKHVTTVSLGSRNTEAGCTLTQGVTGMHSKSSTSNDPLIRIGVLTVLQKLAMLS